MSKKRKVLGSLEELGEQLLLSFQKLSPEQQEKTRKAMFDAAIRRKAMTYEEIVRQCKAGEKLDWGFAGTAMFQSAVREHGTERDKMKLARMGVGFRYERPAAILTLTINDVKFLRDCGISTRGYRKAPLDDTQRLMLKLGFEMTRENYIRVACMGQPPDEIDGEIEAELPDEFQED